MLERFVRLYVYVTTRVYVYDICVYVHFFIHFDIEGVKMHEKCGGGCIGNALHSSLHTRHTIHIRAYLCFT